MRTKVISRWRNAVVAAAAAAALSLPARAQQAQQDAPPAKPDAAPAQQNGAAPQQQEGAAPQQQEGAAAQQQGGSEVRGQLAVPAQPEQPGEGTVYTIQKGDTLWDLSQKFLANPWYWPKIWSQNPYIENPHWIYPGNKLKVTPGAGGAPAQIESAQQGGQDAVEQPGADAANATNASDDARPVPRSDEGADLAVAGNDARELAASNRAVTTAGRLSFQPPPVMTTRASGIVTAEEKSQAGTLEASFEEKQMLSQFDTAYVRFHGEVPAHAGDRLIIFRPDGDVTDPVTHRKLAERARTIGEVKVLSVKGPSATVQVERTWEEVERGDLVRAWTEQNRRVTPRPNRTAVEGLIIGAVNTSLTTYGEAHELLINRGSADGVEEGNTFQVVRQGDGLGSTGGGFTSYAQGAEGDRAAKVGHPEETVGLLMIVDVKEHVSTAVVVKSIREIEAGERVAMRTAGTPGSGGD